MANLSPQIHHEQKTLAQELIDSGRVITWRDLGKAFGITAQAAQMRFGHTYGLALPAREPANRHMVSVSLSTALEGRLEAARAHAAHRDTPGRSSRAHIVREILDAHLPR